VGDPLIIDSSIYINLLRAGEDPGARFRDRIETGSILTCGIIRIEVLRGIVDRRVREWMDRLFDEMVACPLDDALVRSAADPHFRLVSELSVLGEIKIALSTATTDIVLLVASMLRDLIRVLPLLPVLNDITLQEIARDFLDVSFAWGTDVNTFGLPNISAHTAAAEQGGYVNGVLATRLTKNRKIGVTGPVEVGDAKTHIASGADVLTGSSQSVVGSIGAAKDNGTVLWFGAQAGRRKPGL
jgi:hypothetical protein